MLVLTLGGVLAVAGGVVFVLRRHPGRRSFRQLFTFKERWELRCRLETVFYEHHNAYLPRRTHRDSAARGLRAWHPSVLAVHPAAGATVIELTDGETLRVREAAEEQVRRLIEAVARHRVDLVELRYDGSRVYLTFEAKPYHVVHTSPGIRLALVGRTVAA